MRNMPVTPEARQELIPSLDAPILSRPELSNRARECGMDPDNLPAYLAANFGEGGTEDGLQRAGEMLDNRNPGLVVTHTASEADLLKDLQNAVPHAARQLLQR